MSSADVDGADVDGVETFDVVVIGAGPAGEVTAGRLADAGLSVAVVEHERVGGECSFWGCMPSKALLRPGDVLAAARRVPGAAGAVTAEIDVAAAFARRDEIVGGFSDQGQVPWLRDRGVTVIRGHGRLAGRRLVDVDTTRTVVPQESDGRPRRLAARRAVVLATGTSAVRPPILGLADAQPWDNRSATGATTVPRRMVVLGGGAVGTELAQGFRRLGAAEVTVIEGQPRLLAHEEPFVGEEIAEAFTAEGITVVTGRKVTATHRPKAANDEHRGPVVVTLDHGERLEADEILVAVGRHPATDELGLETVGLTPGRPVEVDGHLRAIGVKTATEAGNGSGAESAGAGDGAGHKGWLFAIGDVNGRALLTHMGKYQGRLVADIVAGRRDASGAEPVEVAGSRAIPRVTFTDPQVAAVGLTEAAARDAGLRVRAVSVPTGGVAGSSVRGVGLPGTSHLVVDEDRRVIVGATFTGQDVQELLHSATIALVGQVPLDTLWHAVPPFPTVSEVWLRLLETYGL